jgi:CRISPR-associated exonuclease Cas4
MIYFYVLLFLVAIIWISLIIVKKKYFSEKITECKPKIPIFGYRLYYSDQTSKYGKKATIQKKVLESEKYNLTGKPDFVFKHWRKKIFIPVEIKSGKAGDRQAPYDGDLMQLVAYFLIIEESFGGKVKKGKLVYKDKMFIIKNSRELQKRLFDLLDDMRLMLKTGEGTPNKSFINCKHCTNNGTVCEHTNEMK